MVKKSSFLDAVKSTGQKLMSHPATQGAIAGAKGALKSPGDMLKFKNTRALPGAMKGVAGDAGLISKSDGVFRKAKAIGAAAPEVAAGAAAAGAGAYGASKLMGGQKKEAEEPVGMTTEIGAEFEWPKS